MTDILITRRIDPAAVKLLEAAANVEYFCENRPLPRDFLLAEGHRFDGILCTVSERIDGDVLERAASKLRVVSNMAAGLDNIDVVAARRLGVRIFNSPEPTVEATADHTVAVALALIRKVGEAERFVRNGEWLGWDPEVFQGRTLGALTWGICGYGRIGQAVARRVAAFGARVMYSDASAEAGAVDGNKIAAQVAFETLVRQSDVLSIHVPLTNDTKGLFGARELAAMKPGAFLVNMARGPIVDSGALAEALREGWLAGAALDVFDPEPMPPSHPVLSTGRVVVTPHIGTSTVECRREMAVAAARNLLTYFAEGYR